MFHLPQSMADQVHSYSHSGQQTPVPCSDISDSTDQATSGADTSFVSDKPKPPLLAKVFVRLACLDILCGHRSCTDLRDIQGLKKHNGEQSHKLVQKDRTICELEARISRQEEQTVCLQQELSSTRSIKKSFEQLQINFDVISKDFSDQQTKLQHLSRSESLATVALDERRMEVEALNNTLTQVKNDNSKLQTDLKTSRASHKATQIEVANLQQQYREIKEKENVLQQELATAKEGHIARVQEEKTIEKKRLLLEVRAKSIQSEKENLERRISESDSKVASLQLSLSENEMSMKRERERSAIAVNIAQRQAELLARFKAEVKDGVVHHHEETEARLISMMDLTLQKRRQTESTQKDLNHFSYWMSRVSSQYQRESDANMHDLHRLENPHKPQCSGTSEGSRTMDKGCLHAESHSDGRSEHRTNASPSQHDATNVETSMRLLRSNYNVTKASSQKSSTPRKMAEAITTERQQTKRDTERGESSIVKPSSNATDKDRNKTQIPSHQNHSQGSAMEDSHPGDVSKTSTSENRSTKSAPSRKRGWSSQSNEISSRKKKISS